jgi:hypothetical protein
LTATSPTKPLSLTWNGSTWTLRTAAASEGVLYGLTCTAAEACTAVGSGVGPPAVETWNGSTWATVTTPTLTDVNGGFFDSISCASRTSCTAVGGGFSKAGESGEAAVTLAENWNGSAWSEETTPRENERARNEFEDVSCVGAAGCVGVGFSTSGGNAASLLEVRPEAATPTYTASFGAVGSTGGRLNRPDGVTTDSSGNVWVADVENDRVAEYNAKGEFVLVFGKGVNKTKVEGGGSEAEKNLCTLASGNVCQAGKGGSGSGEMAEPQSVALTAAGNLWVVETANYRVEEFNTKGEYLAQFGSHGSEAGKFSEPWGVAISSAGNIWVSDPGYYRVEEFNSSGGFILELHGAGRGGTGLGEMLNPVGIALDSSGDLWVADSAENRIQEFFAASQYQTVSKFGGTAGSGEGQFNEPWDVAVKPSGNVLVVERSNNRVQEFTSTGQYLTKFGSSGSGTGQFFEPFGIALGRGGALYVADSYNSRVEKWESPTVTEAITQAASGVKTTEATLNATINPGGATTTYHFEYGTTTAYGTSVPLSGENIGSGSEPLSESKLVTGLAPGTTYHYRVVAESAFGASVGSDHTVTTSQLTHTQNIDSHSLNAVYCIASTSDCVASDSAGNAFYATNVSAGASATWSSWAGPGTSPSEAIACPTTSLCLLTDGNSGYGGNLYYATSLGGAWTQAYAPSYGVDAISCVSSSFCVAAQDGSGYFRYSTSPASTSWKLEDQGSASMNSVSCVSSSFCAMVNSVGYVYVADTTAQIESSTWTATDVDGTNSLRGVACTSASSCVAIDGWGNVVNLAISGTTVTASKQDIDGTNVLNGLTCTSGSNCVVVDSLGNVFVSGNGGTTWVEQYAFSTNLTRVSCASASLCATVDSSGNVITFEG